jgi:hypothetical protein
MLNIRITITPEDFGGAVKEKIKEATPVMLRSVAETLIGSGMRGLKYYPPYKYVTRKQAYGRTFQTERQKRWFFWALHSGRILPGYPRRTGRFQRGWRIESVTEKQALITNNEPHSVWLASDTMQARLPALVGWKRVSQTIEDSASDMANAAKVVFDGYLRGL